MGKLADAIRAGSVGVSQVRENYAIPTFNLEKVTGVCGLGAAARGLSYTNILDFIEKHSHLIRCTYSSSLELVCCPIRSCLECRPNITHIIIHLNDCHMLSLDAIAMYVEDYENKHGDVEVYGVNEQASTRSKEVKAQIPSGVCNTV